jgi:hypothetical protein
MQELPKPPVAGRIMRRVDGLVVLAEELAAFLIRKVPENDLRIIRILYLNWLSGHTPNVHRGPCEDTLWAARVVSESVPARLGWRLVLA